jgi:polar amino acid transport system substrate-binding protein
MPPASSAYLALSADADLMSGAGRGADRHHPGRLRRRNGMRRWWNTHARGNRRRREERRGGRRLADKDYLVPMAAESGGELVLLAKEESIGGGVGMAFRESDTRCATSSTPRSSR